MTNHGRTIVPNDRYDCARLATSEEGKAYDKLPMMETADSNGGHTNDTGIMEALNSTSTGDDKFNSLWVVPITIVIFVVVIFLTNSCLGL